MTRPAEVIHGERPIVGDMAKHIATVASRLFASQGYDATSVREIVAASGVTKPTLYYHFGSKEGLAQALLTRPMTQFVANLRACLNASNDPVCNLIAQVNAHFEFIREDADRGRFFYAIFFGPLGSSLSSELAHFSDEIGQVMQEGIAAVVASGAIEASRADNFALAVRGTTVVWSMEYLFRLGCQQTTAHSENADLAQTMITDLIQGFGPSPSPVHTSSNHPCGS